MAIPVLEAAFSSGEVTPSLWGRFDITKMHVAAATLRNAFTDYRGGARSRAGTRFVGFSKQVPATGAAPRLITFDFSTSQQYALEFGNGYVRFIYQGGFVTETPFTITAASNVYPCGLVLASAPGWAAGDWIEIAGVGGMAELNGNAYIVGAISGADVTLYDTTGAPVDATTFGAFTGGGTASRIYQIASPYVNGDWWQLKWAQSADVITFTHPDYPPYNLSRSGPTNWSFALDSRASAIAAPVTVVATATVNPNAGLSPPTLPCAYAYVVTAINSTGQESQASPVANVTDSVDIAATAGSIIVDWTPVTGASYYRIYKAPTSYNTDTGSSTNALPVPVGSLFGLVGLAFGTEFVDSNITQDFSQTPPQHRDPIQPGQILSLAMTASSTDWTNCVITITTATGSGAIIEAVISGSAVVAGIVINPGQGYLAGDAPVFTGDGTSAAGTLKIGPATGTWPALVSYFQQRRVFADSLNEPDTYWMSQPGAFDNFDVSIPVGDSDAITGTPWSEKVDGIEWMLEMPLGLVTFTGSSVQQVTASGTFITSPSAITPTTQIAVPQSTIGASSTLAPVRENWNILHFEPDNATLRELSYQIWFNLYTGADITWQSAHLTFGHQLVDRAWCRKPFYLLWMARDDGVLLSMTYLKEQEVTAWAKHTTQGQVMALCSVFEPPDDVLYLCVQRNVQGGLRYCIERMDDRIWLSSEDPWCVDCAVATTLPTRSSTLTASAGAGKGVAFMAAADTFTVDDVGSTIRMGGGIAVVTAYRGTGDVIGDWVYPCQAIVPDDPDMTPAPQASGNWTIAVPLMSVGGLVHLAGKQVVGLADGIPIGPLTVLPSGFVALPFPASDIKIGLAFTVQVQSVYLDAGQPTLQGRRKSIMALTTRVEASAPMTAAANEVDASTLSPPPLFTTWTGLAPLPASPQQLPPTYTSPGTYGSTNLPVQPLVTGDLRISIRSDWKKQGQAAVQQTLPQPLSVLAFIPEFLPGDTPEDGPRERQQPQGGAGRGQPPRAPPRFRRAA